MIDKLSNGGLILAEVQERYSVTRQSPSALAGERGKPQFRYRQGSRPNLAPVMETKSKKGVARSGDGSRETSLRRNDDGPDSLG
jgi:hypothetical protein